MKTLQALQTACSHIAESINEGGSDETMASNINSLVGIAQEVLVTIGGGSNVPTALDLMGMSDSEILELPGEVLADIQGELEQMAADLKKMVALFDRMVAMKYDKKITKAYKDKGQDTGAASITDGEATANISRSKTVEWDQDGLMAYLDTMKTENARHLATFRVGVSETNFKGAMPDVKAELEKHRTVKVGKTKIVFEKLEN